LGDHQRCGGADGVRAGVSLSKPADIFAEYVALDGAASHIARDLDLSIFCRR
jgi:assimilatory nitrate reductase catalytic subunit